MKKNVINATKLVLADRLITALLGAFALGCIIYTVFVALSLHPSDLQVATHYTAFGSTNFYREKWWYLLSFVIFGIVMAISHIAIVVKVYSQDRRHIALLMIGFSFLMLFISWVLTASILRIAAF